MVLTMLLLLLRRMLLHTSNIIPHTALLPKFGSCRLMRHNWMLQLRLSLIHKSRWSTRGGAAMFLVQLAGVSPACLY
jgi:hypothetical protein